VRLPRVETIVLAPRPSPWIRQQWRRPRSWPPGADPDAAPRPCPLPTGREDADRAPGRPPRLIATALGTSVPELGSRWPTSAVGEMRDRPKRRRNCSRDLPSFAGRGAHGRHCRFAPGGRSSLASRASAQCCGYPLPTITSSAFCATPGACVGRCAPAARFGGPETPPHRRARPVSGVADTVQSRGRAQVLVGRRSVAPD